MLKQLNPEVEWACSGFSAEQIESISSEPWSRVFRLSDSATSVYLKVVPPHKTTALFANSVISKYFRQHVPEVLGFNPVMSALLMADHGGADLQGEFKEVESLLVTYAGLQARAMSMPQLLAELPTVSTEPLYINFMEFMNNDSPLYGAEGKVAASYFLDHQEVEHYHRLFMGRMHLLREFADQAMVLPLTLNHGDLRLPNAAIKQGRIIIFDWDEAMAGPAGLSLYSLFGGCTPLFLLANGMSACPPLEENQQFAQLLSAYLGALSRGGYGDAEKVCKIIPSAACLGAIRYIVSFSDYTVPDETQRQTIAGNIRGGLDDLLALCDLLSLQSRQHPLPYIQDYLETGYFKGVENTAQYYLNIFPDGAGRYEMQKALLQALVLQNKSDESASLADELLKLMPNDVDLLYVRGNFYAERFAYQLALQCYTKAAVNAPERMEIRSSIDTVKYLNKVQQFAADDNNPPTLELPVDWQRNGADGSLDVLCNLGGHLFNQYGALVIRNLFEPSLIAELRDAFARNYSVNEAEYKTSSLSVGDKRYMLSIGVEDPFNKAEIYGSPFLLSLFGQLFEKEFVLGSFTAVTALPGAREQHLHKDRGDLFPGQSTPCFAVTVLIPLVATNPETGGTRIYKSSQRFGPEASSGLPSQDVYADPGDCLLFDYRLSHNGTANYAEYERPVISLVYQRPWFRDVVNFSKQPPICMTREQYEKVPEKLRALFVEPRE